MATVITFINMKGGVGKTTLAVNVAYTLSKIENKKVLLIDMDPQMNATQYTLTESQMEEILADRNKSVYGCLSPDYQANSVLEGYEQRKEEKWIFNVENTFDIIPSSLDIMTLNLAQGPYKLKQYIQNDLGEKYDVVIIDCPPTISEYTKVSLLASDMYLVPMKAEPLSVFGLPMLENYVKETIQKVYPHYYPSGAVQFFLDLHDGVDRCIAHERQFLQGVADFFLEAVVRGVRADAGEVHGE